MVDTCDVEQLAGLRDRCLIVVGFALGARRCELAAPNIADVAIASAALRALRMENPELTWHTGSGHMRDSTPFWRAVGEGVPGGYEQRAVCEHVARHSLRCVPAESGGVSQQGREPTLAGDGL